MLKSANEHQLREVFNRWAENGRGEEMAEDHLSKAFPLSPRRRAGELLGFRTHA